MELEKFIENFAEQFDTVDASDLQADTEFKALEEWSSLSALSVIAMIDCQNLHLDKTIKNTYL
jgi:acyl carrier protein